MNSSSGNVNKLNEMWESGNEKWLLNNCCHHIVLAKTAPDLSFHRDLADQ